MTNKYAIVVNGFVDNVVLAEPEFAIEQGWIEAPDYVDGKVLEPGWTYDGTRFVAPEEPVVEVPPPAPPTKEELMEQLATISTQIQALG